MHQYLDSARARQKNNVGDSNAIECRDKRHRNSPSYLVDILQALHYLDQQTVEVIFSDINMPVMDGAVFVGELAKSDLKKKIPVIVVSTDSSTERKNQMQSLGAKGYIAKPFSPEQLEQEVVRLLWEASDDDE